MNKAQKIILILAAVLIFLIAIKVLEIKLPCISTGRQLYCLKEEEKLPIYIIRVIMITIAIGSVYFVFGDKELFKNIKNSLKNLKHSRFKSGKK